MYFYLCTLGYNNIILFCKEGKGEELHQTSDYCGSLDTINLKLLQNLQTVFLLGMDLVNQD